MENKYYVKSMHFFEGYCFVNIQGGNLAEDKNFKFYYDKAGSTNPNAKTTIKIEYGNIPKAKKTCEFFILIAYMRHIMMFQIKYVEYMTNICLIELKKYLRY